MGLRWRGRGRGTIGVKGAEAGDELGEGDFAIFVFVEHFDDSLDEGVLRQLWDVEELVGLERA